MSRKKKSAAPAPTAPASAMPKEWRYVGPRPAARIKFPGSYETFYADNLTPEQRERYLKGNPSAKTWWR